MAEEKEIITGTPTSSSPIDIDEQKKTNIG